MRHIKIVRSDKVALVDDIDYHEISSHRWYRKSGRTTTYVYTIINNKWISMQSYIMSPVPTGKTVDHIDRDGLNNQRFNLRYATAREQRGNQVKYILSATSKYKGVTWDKVNNRWIAQIYMNNKHKNLGRFSDEIEAAKRYDRAAREFFGIFAVLNFPE